MARQGVFDGELLPEGWFDAELQAAGWFDTDLTAPAAPAGGSITENGHLYNEYAYDIVEYDGSTGVIGLSASLNKTQAGDSLTADASVLPFAVISADLVASQADNTSSATAVLPIAASLTASQADNTSSATATMPIAASLTATQAGDSLTAAAGVLAAANLTASQAGDSVSAVTAVQVTANQDASQAGDSLVATGTVSSDALLALDVTQDDNTATGTAVLPIVSETYLVQDGNSSVIYVAFSTIEHLARAPVAGTGVVSPLTPKASSGTLSRHTAVGNLVEHTDRVAVR